jgi:transposase
MAELMRISWRSAERIVERVVAEARARADLLEGLRSIGIDEVSYKKGHRYLMIVVDHERDRLVWAAEGRNAATASAFFDALGLERCAALEFVSADGALWIEDIVTRRCPTTTLCADPFHVVQWATDALGLFHDASGPSQRCGGFGTSDAAIGPSACASLCAPRPTLPSHERRG